ncbi:hybrid sensor histidine kinase/response regulator, partial [Oxalobacteraceae bacterium OM1]
IQTAHPLLPKVQEIIQRQVDRMVSLLDDLLDASRIASGQIALQRRIVPLQDIVRQAVEMSRPRIEQRQQRFDVDAVPSGLLVDADAERLAQALANLLENASSFTHEKGHIALRVHATPNHVALCVQDNGRGIEARLLPHVFELFVQGPRALDRSEGGLGIGLSVAKGIAEMHGGRIAVASEGAGRGASFEITLPLAAARGDAVRIDPAELERAPDGCSILIVEDNADLVSTLVTILELEGHHVMTSVDGVTGLALAKSRPFDVIICDIGLPGLDGYGLIAQVRQHASERRPYAIAISGYSQEEDRERALAAGFDHYVTKPLRGTNLLRLIAARPAA